MENITNLQDAVPNLAMLPGLIILLEEAITLSMHAQSNEKTFIYASNERQHWHDHHEYYATIAVNLETAIRQIKEEGFNHFK